MAVDPNLLVIKPVDQLPQNNNPSEGDHLLSYNEETKELQKTDFGKFLADIAGGWTVQTQEEEYTRTNGDKVVIKKVVDVVGGVGTAPAALTDNIGKYYAAAGGFTDDKELAADYKGPRIEYSISKMTGQEIFDKSEEYPANHFSAIWKELNKPIWHIGNSVFVDAVGATVEVVDMTPMLVFTIKLTEDNQTFIFPSRNDGSAYDCTINWGDGTEQSYKKATINKSYTAPAGTEFQIKVTGVIKAFDFSGANSARNTSRSMLKSIDKNTLPKNISNFYLYNCDNLVYLGPNSFGCYSGDTMSLMLVRNSTKTLVIHKKAFAGLNHVTTISKIFGDGVANNPIQLTEGCLDYFENVTEASYLFASYQGESLPFGLFDKMTNLENISFMLYRSKLKTINNRIFKNQKKLQNVSSCLRWCESLVADASILYADMNQGAPTNTSFCFNASPAMTNLNLVPSTWKQ